MNSLILKILIFTAVLLAAGRIVVSNVISTSGVALGSLDEKIAAIKNENDLLREELFSRSSLGNIASQAGKLGFTDKKESYVLTSPLPVALR